MTAMHARQPYKGQRELQRSKKHENQESLKNKRQKSRKNKLTNANKRKVHSTRATIDKFSQAIQKDSKSETRKGKTISNNSSTTQSQS